MKINFNKNLGLLLLGIWLIATGLSAFVPVLGSLGLVWALLAIVAGILIVIGR
jgi:hypothetical protein